MLKVRSRHLILLWWMALGGLLTAQPQDLHLYTLSIQQGLSNSTVYSIHQDSRGFMWFGTAEGLNRYDGYGFQVFMPQPGQVHAIGGEMVTDIAEDKEGNLWMGVWYGGLNCYEKSTGRFNTYLPDSGAPSNSEKNSVWTVAVDRQGYVWAGTQRNGLYRFDPRTKRFKVYQNMPGDESSLSSNAIAGILPDGDHLWVATADKGLDLLDLNTGHFRHYTHLAKNERSLLSNQLNTLFLDRQGNLWIGTRDKGISVLAADRQSFTNFPPSDMQGRLGAGNIRCFLQDDKGLVWIGSDGGGLHFYDPDSGAFTRVVHNPGNPAGIQSNTIFSLYKSREGIIWIGNYKGGLNVFDRKKFRFQPKDPGLRPEGLSYKVVMSILEDAEGSIWFGSDGGGIDRYDKQSRRFIRYQSRPEQPNTLSGNAVKSLYQDRYGNLWAGTYGKGLSCLPSNQSKWVRFQYDASDSESLGQDHAWDIAEDAEGGLWVATLGGGLSRLNWQTMTFRRFNTSNAGKGLLSDQVYTIFPDTLRKRLWVGTAMGVCFYDLLRQQFQVAFPDSANMVFEVKAIQQDSKGRIWFGTKKNGLYCFDPEKQRLRVYRREDGLISNTIAAILEDDRRFLWISTNRGLSRLDPERGVIFNYTTDDGLRNTEYLSESACRLRNGNLLFGGSEGFDLIDASHVTLNQHIPPVVVTGIWVMNQPFRPDSLQNGSSWDIPSVRELRLRHDEDILSIEFAALNFTNPEQNQYAYRLEGLDLAWKVIGNRRLITFTNLKPGQYRLRVKASNNDGFWNEKGLTLDIRVLPSWWQSWAFRLSGILSLAALVIVVIGFWFRNRQRQGLEVSVQAPGSEGFADVDVSSQSDVFFFQNVRSPADLAFLQKARVVVEDHLSDPEFSVAAFVKQMGVSRSLLHQKLKESTNQSASDFIRSIRLQHAAQLLLQRRHTVSEVAYMVGFNDPKYFHKCFKEVYGVTPGNYASRN